MPTDTTTECNEVVVGGSGSGFSIGGGDIIIDCAILRKTVSAKPNNKSMMPWETTTLLRRCGDQEKQQFRGEEEESEFESEVALNAFHL